MAAGLENYIRRGSGDTKPIAEGDFGPIANASDRFYLFSPEEKDALRILIQNHLNTISEISLHKDFRVMGYIDWLAELEEELKPF